MRQWCHAVLLALMALYLFLVLFGSNFEKIDFKSNLLNKVLLLICSLYVYLLGENLCWILLNLFADSKARLDIYFRIEFLK